MLRIMSFQIVTKMPDNKLLKLMTKAEQATTRKKAQKVLKKVKKLASARQECDCPLDLLNDSCD